MLSKALVVQLATLGFAVISSIFAQPAQCAKNVPVWHIKQSSYNLGNVEIFLCKDGMRWHNAKVGLTFIVHAPDWKLNAINETNKKYIIMNKSEALAVFQQQRRRDNSEVDVPIRVAKNMVIAGLPTVCYCYAHSTGGMTPEFGVQATRSMERGLKLTAAQKKYIDNALNHERREYWLCKDISVAPEISALFLERVAASTYGNSFPLRLVQIGRDGIETTMLDTREVKKITVSPDTFKLPQGYTKAENKVALLVNDNELDGFAGEDASPAPVSSKLKPGKHEEVHR